MAALVKVYVAGEPEFNLCHECAFVAAWEVKPEILPQNPIYAWACDEDLATVVFLIEKGKIPPRPPKTPNQIKNLLFP